MSGSLGHKGQPQPEPLDTVLWKRIQEAAGPSFSLSSSKALIPQLSWRGCLKETGLLISAQGGRVQRLWPQNFLGS